MAGDGGKQRTIKIGEVEAAVEAKNMEGGRFISLTTEHVQGIFYVLGMGYVTSLMLFMVEICVDRAST